jgi:hypothetical protein
MQGLAQGQAGALPLNYTPAPGDFKPGSHYVDQTGLQLGSSYLSLFG